VGLLATCQQHLWQLRKSLLISLINLSEIFAVMRAVFASLCIRWHDIVFFGLQWRRMMHDKYWLWWAVLWHWCCTSFRSQWHITPDCHHLLLYSENVVACTCDYCCVLVEEGDDSSKTNDQTWGHTDRDYTYDEVRLLAIQCCLWMCMSTSTPLSNQQKQC